jgi:pyruvate-ferredoxin/flavodoxin oxidoreductase
MLVANATGCSSIYGGNLPTTPWTVDSQGRGPAWSNSLFEDNAEFGLGMRVALDQQRSRAQLLLQQLAPQLDETLVSALLSAEEGDEAAIHEQRERVTALKEKLATLSDPLATQFRRIADALCRKSVWIIGGDGWAYDIGFGGLDHVLSTNSDVNILVLDTEVYSNTGGQTSKATPRAAVAKFSAAGKVLAKKDLARMAMTYEHVYVAQVAYGAKDIHTLHAFLEAESYCGPSLIIAYAPCIAHGVDMAHNHQQQQLAVDSGHWPLFRRDPRKAGHPQGAFKLDSAQPDVDYRRFLRSETRFNMLNRTHPERVEALHAAAAAEVQERYAYYAQLAQQSATSASNETPEKEPRS